MDDSLLIQQTLNGNRNAFRFLVLRYQKSIFKLLGTLVHDSQLVEELAQETFLRTYQSLASFDPRRGAGFSTWLFTIARNLAFNELAKRKVRRAKSEELAQALPQATPEPERELESAQAKTMVREAIERLPQEFQSAVVLSCLKGHSISEIARIEGCAEGTVKSRIHRGKRMLREFLASILGGSYGKSV